jgi:hypothetical protein
MSALLPFWDALLLPLFKAAQPRSVLLCALRADDGLPRRILEASTVASLHVADPDPDFDPAQLRLAYPDRLILHRAAAADALRLIPTPDLLLLGGDANWFTVGTTLEAAHFQALALKRGFPLTLVANAGWPYARRDRYGAPAMLPEAACAEAVIGGLHPHYPDPRLRGGIHPGTLHSKMQDQPRLGVLTAIEDFVIAWAGERAARPELVTIPGMSGLAILKPPSPAESVRAWFDACVPSVALRDLLDSVEQERLLALAAVGDLRDALESEQAAHAALRGLIRATRLQANGRMPEAQAGEQGTAAPRSFPELAGPDAADTEYIFRSPAFDADWYLAKNPDVAAAGVHPAAHYFRCGAAEGREPGPDFQGSWYLAAYPDIAASGANPLLHYLRGGAAEGRDPGPHFSTSLYLRRYTDVSAAGLNPLEHWISAGRAEGREA